MDLKPGFAFEPQPPIRGPQLLAAIPGGSPLGQLEGLLGTWSGPGFNTIWRPNSTPGQSHFLELNVTSETIEFIEIPGAIPNRGLLQGDINMFGLTYLQQVSDANTGAGLHIEPGIWANVPATTNPLESPTVVRMASIPHGTTMNAQGAVLSEVAGPPLILPADITPFQIGSPSRKIQFPESNLSIPTQFRSANLTGITQAMVDNPNSVLTSAIAGQTITNTVILDVSTSSSAPGGGTSNTAFLVGAAGGPNADAALVTSTFWIETVQPAGDVEPILQLQYTQNVLLDFNGLSWPHVTVATLTLQKPGS